MMSFYHSLDCKIDLKNYIRKLLEDEIHKVGTTRRRLIELAGICQKLGFDDLADTALKKAKIAPDPVCDELIKKTLENYGIQECD